jgi:hypothetical protein
MSTPGAEAVRAAILEALATGPATKAALARRLAVRPVVLGGHVGTLESRGQVVIRGGLVALPGQLDGDEPKTEEERLREQFRMLWQRRGLLTVCPADIQDNFLRAQLSLLGMQLYGRRGSPR